MALLEFTEVRLSSPGEQVRAYAIESPRARTKAAEEAVTIGGWIIGQPVPAVAIEVRFGEDTIGRFPVGQWRLDVVADYTDVPGSERSGFGGQVDLSRLAAAGELELVAVLADETRLPLAVARVRRPGSGLDLTAAPAEAGSTDADGRPAPELADHGESVVMPRCSIIVPVHNRPELTKRCVDTLLTDVSPSPRFEVIVVDDASTDDVPTLLDGYQGRIRTVSLTQNVGFAGACNAGAAVARGDYLVFLNSDTVPQPNWLGALASHANVNLRAAVVGAKLLFVDDTIQHAGVVFDLNRYPHHLYAGFPADHPAVGRARRFKAVTAACCLVRRRSFEEVGGFDRAYVNGWEDVDLCLRLGERGYEVHYTPHSVVYHLESSSRDPRSPTERHNRSLFAQRWLDRIESDCLDYYVEDKLLRVGIEAPLYPVLLEVSPRLAVVQNESIETTRLLNERAEQIDLLQKRVAELEDALRLAEQRASEAASAAAPA